MYYIIIIIYILLPFVTLKVNITHVHPFRLPPLYFILDLYCIIVFVCIRSQYFIGIHKDIF